MPDDNTTDQSHLNPDRLRVGPVGVFAGDWAWEYDTDGHAFVAVGFVGTLVDTWNGWAVYTCTRDVAAEIVAEQHRVREVERANLMAAGVRADTVDDHVDAALVRLDFDGDDIDVDERRLTGDAEARWSISPNLDGHYDVMGRTWTWVPVAPSDCRRIAGILPAARDQQRFVPLIHSDLQAPHDRLRVTALEQRITGDGVAFTAALALDGDVVATVTNTGTGGPTALSGDAAGRLLVADFVARCRWQGQPATEEQVLDALIDEYDLDRMVTAATRRGDTIARLVDRDGLTRTLRPITDLPPGLPARDALGHQLVAEYRHTPGQLWLIWSSGAWRFLANHTT
jgi:hypothetical protein